MRRLERTPYAIQGLRPRAPARSLHAALAHALSRGSVQRVAWLGLTPAASMPGQTIAALDPVPEGTLDAIVLGPIAGEPTELLSSAASRACDRGLVIWALPIRRAGLSGVAQRTIAAWDPRSQPRALTEACALMLCAGVSPLKVIEIQGARGQAVLYGPRAPT